MSHRSFIHALAALSCILLCGCGKEAAQPSSRGVKVSFRAERATKALPDSEDGVLSVDVLVFDASTGLAESHARSAGGTATVRVPVGRTLDWVVVANAPQGAVSSIARESDLLAALSPLGDSASGGLVMTGRGSGSFTASSSVSVALTRLVSKVTVENVVPSFADAQTAALGVTFDRVFLVNACACCAYGLEPSAGPQWCNMMSLDGSLPSAVRPLLVREYGTAVASPDAIEAGCSLYCMPNPTDNAVNSLTSPGWSVRDTRAVLQFTIAGEANYYPIDLPGMECNTEYIIRSVELLGPGSYSPDVPVDRRAIAFEVEVAPWGASDSEVTLE